MPLADALRRLLRGETRDAAPSAATPPPTAPAGLSTALPPWGNQWPVYGGRNLAENLSVVTACVQAIAGAIASLPACVMQDTSEGGRIERPDHPVSRLIRQPNPLQSWSDWLEWLLSSVLLQGNAVAVLDHDGAGRPIGLFPVPWWACQPILVPSNGAEAIGSPVVPNSRLVFDVTSTMCPWPMPGPRAGATGFPIRYFADEVVFLRDRSDDGVIGRSRLSRCPEALACGLGAQGFSASVWANGAITGGVLTFPGRIGKTGTDNLAASWRDSHSGASNAGRVVILEEGGKFEHMAVSPEDAELLDSRRFSVEELARLFGVPPPLVGDWTHSTFASAAVASQWFGSLTLLPWVQKIEREFDRVVFNDPTCHLSIDLAGMLRGDYASRTAANVNLVRAGIMSADEARREEGLDPRGGEADELRPQAVGGRPVGTGDGEGESFPAPGAKPNGSGKANGQAAP